MLRLVSFNLDYYWASRSPDRPVEVRSYGMPSSLLSNNTSPQDPAVDLSTRHRPLTPHDFESYNALNYVAYALYPPLYLAGPIITFNDFLWQVSGSPTRRTLLSPTYPHLDVVSLPAHTK